jgi:hypothetical protein|tara:strand:- start:395 stop:550 length:156 start_codon:yes stop_codon:yes gene_type:complete
MQTSTHPPKKSVERKGNKSAWVKPERLTKMAKCLPYLSMHQQVIPDMGLKV